MHDYLQYGSSGVRLACAPAAALPFRRLCVTSCSMILLLCPHTGDAGPAMPMNNFVPFAVLMVLHLALISHGVFWALLAASALIGDFCGSCAACCPCDS